MIKSKEGVIDIEGDAAEICADFACMVHALVFAFATDIGEDDAKELITSTFYDGLNCEDKLEDESEGVEIDFLGLVKQLKEEAKKKGETTDG